MTINSNMRSKTNMPVRNRCIEKGVFITDLARELNIADSTMYVRMRREMPLEKQQELIRLIDRIADSRKG